MPRFRSLLVAAALVATGASTRAIAQTPPDVIMIDPRSDNGRSVDGRVGMVLAFGLPNNAGTGFFWRVVADRNALAIGAPRTVRSSASGGGVGFATTEIVTARPRRVGVAELRFILARPGGEAARDIRVRIDAR